MSSVERPMEPVEPRTVMLRGKLMRRRPRPTTHFRRPRRELRHQTVNAVEEAAVPRDEPAAVLHAEAALQRGFPKVASDRRRAAEQADGARRDRRELQG
jgi:hypothetical protein